MQATDCRQHYGSRKRRRCDDQTRSLTASRTTTAEDLPSMRTPASSRLQVPSTRSGRPKPNITIRATSADGSFTDQVFSIAIVDANEFAVTAPTHTDATTNAVDENVTIGTVVGITASSSDSDATTNTVTYSLFDNDGGNFTIDANTGVVTTAAALNRETLGASRNITVRATSATVPRLIPSSRSTSTTLMNST